MNSNTYTDRELETKFDDVHEKLDRILEQTTKTNGRVSSLETKVLKQDKIFLVVGTAILVLLIVNGSKFVDFAKTLAGI